jgi:hypothetical protein
MSKTLSGRFGEVDTSWTVTYECGHSVGSTQKCLFPKFFEVVGGGHSVGTVWGRLKSAFFEVVGGGHSVVCSCLAESK